MLQQTMAIFLVLALLFSALWLLRRKGLAVSNLVTGIGRSGKKSNAGQRMQVLERVVLTPQHVLHLVLIENRLLLFSTSPAGCQAVDYADSAVPSEPGAPDWKEAASC